jgi:hypothetical protein
VLYITLLKQQEDNNFRIRIVHPMCLSHI